MFNNDSILVSYHLEKVIFCPSRKNCGCQKQYHCGIKRESGLTAGRRRIRPLLVVQCRVFIPASTYTETIEMTQLVVFICLCTHMRVCVYVCLPVCLCKKYNHRKISLRVEGTRRGSRDGSCGERAEMGGGI